MDWDFASTFHEASDAEKNPNRPPARFLWIFLFGWEQRFGVMLQFLMTVWTRVGVKEVA
jgi:hypothetical protein